MKIALANILLISTAFPYGCGRAPLDGSADPPFVAGDGIGDDGDLLNSGLVGEAERLLKGLKAACEKGGGRLVGMDCICQQANMSFSGEVHKCVEKEPWFFNKGCVGKSGREFQSCLRLGLWIHGATKLGLDVEHVKAEDVAHWIKTVAPTLTPRIPPTPVHGSGATVLISVGAPPAFGGDAIKRAFDNQLYHPQTDAMVPAKGYAHLYVSSLNELSDALGTRRSFPSSANISIGAQKGSVSAHNGRAEARADAKAATLEPPLAVSRGQGSDPLLHDLDLAVRLLKSKDAVAKAPIVASSNIGGSCLDACEFQRKLELGTSSGRQAIVVDRYVKGVRQNRELRLLSPTNELVEAKVVFDFGDRPSLVYIPSVVREDDELITRVRVLDKSLNELGSYDFELVEDAQILDQLDNTASSRLQDDELAIVSFETGYSFLSPETFAWILRGPHADPNPQKGSSLIGWYGAENDAALAYARGFIPTYQDSPFADRVVGDHPYAVNSILTGRTGLSWSQGFKPTRVIPLGSSISSPMMAHAVSEAMSTHKDRVRVGSLSVKFLIDENACRVRVQALRHTGLLLAVAAGNEGQDIATTDLCPQRLSPAPDILVVGAARDGKRESYSNFGAASVDIAADGDAPAHNTQGTSFAAPRVAYAAAQLAAAQPGATNAQIRMALLLSAELPLGSELPVRCGGSLAHDLEGAFAALGTLVSSDTADMGERVPFSVAYAVAKEMKNHVAGNVARRVGILIKNKAVCADANIEDTCEANDTLCKLLRINASKEPLCDF